MSHSLVEQQDKELSRAQLQHQDESGSGIFFPLTSKLRSPAANYDVVFAFELPRSLWYDGAAVIGRPRADGRCCAQVSLALLLIELASRTTSPLFWEILVDQSVPDTAAHEHRAHPGAVRGYRLWWAAPMAHVIAASQVLAELLGGPDPTKAKRMLDGTTKIVVPGEFAVSYDRFYNEAQYVATVQAYGMGLYQGFSGGLSYQAEEQGPHAQAVGGDDEDMFFDTDAVETAPSAPATEGGVLPDAHALASFEAGRLFGQTMTENRHSTFNLRPRQAELSSYVGLRGQLDFPFPELVHAVQWNHRFSSSKDFHELVLPEFLPCRDMIADAIGSAVAMQGGNVWQDIRAMTVDQLLALFNDTADVPLVDMTSYAPIRAPRHWQMPTAATAMNTGAGAMARVYYAVERTKQYMLSIRALAREHPEVDDQKLMLDRMSQIFDTVPDAGVPATYYEVGQDHREIESLVKDNVPLGQAVKRTLYSRAAMRSESNGAPGPMDYGSVLVSQLAATTTETLGLTQIQAVPFLMIYMAMGKLAHHSCEGACLLISLEGHIALGKTKILETVASVMPQSAILLQATMSAMADCKHETAKLSLRDDIMAEAHDGKKQSELSLRSRSHSVNEANPNGSGRRVVNRTYVRNCAHLWSMNHWLPPALASRAIQVSMFDDADAAGGKSKMDLAAAPMDRVSQMAATLSMKTRIIWCYEFYQQEALGGFTINDDIFYACIAIMRKIMNDAMSLTTRLIDHCRTIAIGMMTLRVTGQWHCVMKRQLQKARPDEDLAPMRLRFYQYRSIVTAADFIRSMETITRVANKDRYVLQVAAAIRETIVMEQGDQVAADSEDPLYYLTDLPANALEIADRLTPVLKSMKGQGLVATFIRQLLAEAVNGHPVLKVAQSRSGRGGRKLLVLKSYITDGSVVTDREQTIMSALLYYWEQSWEAESGARRASVEFAEDPPTDPMIVFRNDIKNSLYKPGDDYSFDVYEGLLDQPPAALSRTLAFMQERRDDFKLRDKDGRYLNLQVANVFDPASVPLLPENSRVVEPTGIIHRRNPDLGLHKAAKEWQGVVAVRYSTLMSYKRRSALGMAQTERLHADVFTAVLAAEGATDVGDVVAIGVQQQPDAATGHPCTSVMYTGVVPEWSLQVRNPLYTREVPGAAADDDSDDDLADADCDSTPVENVVFPTNDEYRTFTAHSNLYESIERKKAIRETGSAIPRWAARSVADRCYAAHGASSPILTNPDE